MKCSLMNPFNPSQIDDAISPIAPAAPDEGADETRATLDVVTRDYFAPIVADKFPAPDQRIELGIHISASESTDV